MKLGNPFIFAGSCRHLMCEKFVSPQGPFYQSTQILDLLPIPCDTYGDFASSFFKSGGRTFDKAAFDGAIAKRGVVAEPNSADFLSMPGLPGASTVRAALKDLDGKDVIYRSEAGWIVYDRLFGEWLRTSQI